MAPTVFCIIGLLAAAAQPVDPRESARQILERGRYQTELPAASPAAGSAGPPAEVRAGPRAGGSDRGAPREPRTAMPGIPLPPAVLAWALFAGLLAAALAWAVRHAIRARRGADVDPASAAPVLAAPSRRTLRIGPLTDVEDLARRGRYGEAIHLLLLHLFTALQRRPATAPAPAHTSREVLARTPLAGDARAALGVLVSAAESIHFGGRQAVREDYENCLGHYRRFLASFERAS